MAKTQTVLPVNIAAIRAGMARERLIRKIQTGELRGELRDGRWFVDAADVDRLERERNEAGAGVGA